MTVLNFGALADALHTKIGEIAKLQAKIKDLEGEKHDLENKLLAGMEGAGTDIVRGKKATVNISETQRYRIADMEKFEPFCNRKKAIHLFERRLSSAACKEMVESLGGKPIPGVEVFTQKRLNVRKAG